MVKSSKPTSMLKSSSTKKSPRGVDTKDIKFFETVRNHKIKIVKDKKQCIYALGNIDCNGKLKCYLCDTYLIPHYDTYLKCLQNKKTTIWKKFIYKSNSGFYPQCEHIVPCASKLTQRPWYMNIMLYSIHNKMFKKYDIKPNNDISTITNFNIKNPLQLSADQKKYIF
jgi:hypothetical protein